MTRKRAANFLGISDNTFNKWVSDGVFTRRRAIRLLDNGATREVDVFDPRELAARSRRPRDAQRAPVTPGEIAARAFAMFDDGFDVRSVVRRLEITSADATHLRDQWIDGGGSDVVIGPVAAAEISRFIGPFEGVAGLVGRIRELHAARVEAVVPDDASDAQIEQAIVAVLDRASGSGASEL